MKTRIFLPTVLLALFVCLNTFAQKSGIVPDQYIVILKESSAKPVLKINLDKGGNKKQTTDREEKQKGNETSRQNTLKKVREVSANNKLKSNAILAEFADVTVGFAAKLSEKEVRELKNDPNVEGVYEDYYIEMDTDEDFDLTCVEVSSSMLPQSTDCAITKAGGPVNGSNKATWIWIIDSGIDLDHPDLNVITSSTYAKSYIPGETPNDGCGHGTHVAGIAAARDNSIGVVGVSAGAKVVPLKVFDNSCDGAASFASTVLTALNHVAMYDIPGDVVNMSLRIGIFSVNCESGDPALRNAIQNLGLAGTHVVMSAGNLGVASNTQRPGCINGTRVYTVGNITCANAYNTGSNFGIPSIDWVAVGTSVYSTLPGGVYGYKTGTSMSAPVVAGIVHSKNAAPVSLGNVVYGGTTYKIAKR
ncbi:MAG: S8 family serine peptidase [Sphingobacteriales bacterium]|nr:MAG: S8 family serine peptidase [Sphingobacteriales bacterium]